MKLKFLLISLVLITACQSNKKKKAEEKYPPMEVVLKDNDKLEYQDDKYSVVSTEEGYDIIFHVYNNEKQKRYDFSSDYEYENYEAIINDYLILSGDESSDQGVITLIDMNTGEKVKQIYYINYFEIKDKKIYYQKIIDKLPKGVTPPECPDLVDLEENFEYIEKCYFDFENMQEVHTKNIICQFVS